MPTPRDRDPLLETFADELRFRREQAELSRNRLGEALGCTPQWIGKVEACEKPPSEAFAQDLDTFFATGGLFHRQWEKIKKYRRSRVLLPGFSKFIEFEARAVLVRAFAPTVIPGLLQTEEYMRALIGPNQRPALLDEVVGGRLGRQKVVFDHKIETQVWYVIDEAVLHRIIGGPQVMRAQLERVRDVVDSGQVDVRILPFQSVTYAGLDGMFVTLTLGDGTEVAYHEGPGVNQLTEDPAVVNECRIRFDLVMGEAYPKRDSLEIIDKTLENLK